MDSQGKVLEIRDEKRNADRSCQIHEKKMELLSKASNSRVVRVSGMPRAQSHIGKVTWPTVVV